MDRETAKQVLSRLELCVAQLSEVVQLAHALGNPSEDRTMRRCVGQVLSEMQDRLLDPLLREHPDLISADHDYRPLDGPTWTALVAKLERTGSLD